MKCPNCKPDGTCEGITFTMVEGVTDFARGYSKIEKINNNMEEATRKVSNCCSAKVDEDYMICSNCLEPCGIVEEE